MVQIIGERDSQWYNQATETVMCGEKMLGNRLRMVRESRGLSQVELARRVNVKSATINRYEQGVRNPDPEMLDALANELEVSVDYLLGRTDNPKGHGQPAEGVAFSALDRLPPDVREDVEKLLKHLERKYPKKPPEE